MGIMGHGGIYDELGQVATMLGTGHADQRKCGERIDAVRDRLEALDEHLQGAEDDLGAIGHAFLAYENAPLADRGTYRAELLAKVREIGERREWVAEVGHA